MQVRGSGHIWVNVVRMQGNCVTTSLYGHHGATLNGYVDLPHSNAEIKGDKAYGPGRAGAVRGEYSLMVMSSDLFRRSACVAVLFERDARGGERAENKACGGRGRRGVCHLGDERHPAERNWVWVGCLWVEQQEILRARGDSFGLGGT